LIVLLVVIPWLTNKYGFNAAFSVLPILPIYGLFARLWVPKALRRQAEGETSRGASYGFMRSSAMALRRIIRLA